MKESYNTLIVDDHHLVLKGIISTLHELTESKGLVFETHLARRSSQALSILRKHSSFDLAFLDIKLPPEPDIEMYSGEDLGMKIRKLYPAITIIVITAYDSPIRIKSIMNNISPEGFIIKGDTLHGGLVSAIEQTLNNPPYYSSTVLGGLVDFANVNITLDKLDIQLLIQLDRGRTMGEIAEQLFLSRSAIVKRKQKLKLQLEIESGNDRDLINRAYELGFI